MAAPTPHSNDAAPATAIHPSFINRLDKDFIEYYNKHFASKPAQHGIKIEDIRANIWKFASPWYKDFSNEEFVKDIQIKADDGHIFTARCYHPDSKTSPFGEGPYPVHINFHGGGWTFGSLFHDAKICMEIRNRLGVLVVDVDYRLCPENVFGKGTDDGWAAVRWVHENAASINGRGDCISIGGISAGASLSATIQHLARNAGLPLKLAILAVPATTWLGDITSPESHPCPSFLENQYAPSLNWSRIDYFRQYFRPKNDAERAELFARPLFYRSQIDCDVTGLCDTFVCTAECDPLRDEGEAYAAKLLAAGVRVSGRRYTGVPHPFMHMAELGKAKLYLDDICAELKRVNGN